MYNTLSPPTARFGGGISSIGEICGKAVIRGSQTVLSHPWPIAHQSHHSRGRLWSYCSDRVVPFFHSVTIPLSSGFQTTFVVSRCSGQALLPVLRDQNGPLASRPPLSHRSSQHGGAVVRRVCGLPRGAGESNSLTLDHRVGQFKPFIPKSDQFQIPPFKFYLHRTISTFTVLIVCLKHLCRRTRNI